MIMRLTFSQNHQRSGYALFMVLVFTGVVLTLFASMMYWAATNAKITKRNNLYVQSQAAAESAVEVTLATMLRDFFSSGLNPASSYTALTLVQSNWPVRFQISDASGNVDSVSVTETATNWTTLPDPYFGLNGWGQDITISARAAALNQLYPVSAPVTQKIWFGTIPIFQFAIFYNIPLEFNPGAAMFIGGKVHSNSDIFATGNDAGNPLTFSDIVEAAGAVTLTPSPKDPQNPGRSGNVVFNLTANNPRPNVNSLNLPIGGTNRDPLIIRALLDLPPPGLGAPNLGAYNSEGQLYPFNEADLIISNAVTGGTNIAMYYQNGYINGTPLQQITPDITNFVVSGGVTNITSRYFSWVTNVTFYDFRENSYVRAVQIDVAKLRAWLANTSAGAGAYWDGLNTTNPLSSKGHHINGIYVVNSIPFDQGVQAPPHDGTLPAVRVVNGEQLPLDGLTIATSRPLYVVGNYNVTRDGVHYALTLGSTTNGSTWPSAFLADSITIVSTNWDDTTFTRTNGNGNVIAKRKPTDTTLNAACFEGIVQSDGAHYSGGVENFLRLMEDWGNKRGAANNTKAVLTYNGSIVVMFPSQYADSPWQPTGNYYGAPNRQWGFDITFTTPTNKIPMAPRVFAILRKSWDSK